MNFSYFKSIALLFTAFIIFSFAVVSESYSLNFSARFSNNDNSITYNLSKPTKVFDLPSKLAEISGLDFDTNTNVLISVNDEKGKIYGINKFTGAVLGSYSFGKSGDYEGIEQLNDKIAVVNSSGTIYLFDTESQETIKIKTPLSEENDVEGLAFSEDYNALLLACKGRSLNNSSDTKSIYAFNLDNHTLEKFPFLEIDQNELKGFLVSKSAKPSFLKRINKFAPSGISIHPETGDFYICSARGSSLVIFNAEKTIKEIIFFNEDDMPQPEGITFDNDSNLFISSEGDNYGKIFVFDSE